MLNSGNQFPMFGNDITLIKNQIQNYGKQLENLSFQLNNINSINNNMNNIYIPMNNMGIQINNNINQFFNMNNYQNNLSILQNDFKSCSEDPYLINSGTKLELENNNFNIWKFTLQGPLGTPYEEGFFTIKINFPIDYPSKGAQFSFINKIYHPNVGKNEDPGYVCYPIFNSWRIIGRGKGEKKYSIKLALYDLYAFFYKPCLDCGLHDDMCQLYIKDRKKFNEEARNWTKLYASKIPDNFIKRHNYPFF